MRFESVKAIYKRALSDPKIFFLTGDLGHAHIDDFKKNLPHQYINVGIAEQNLIGIAAGLALSGNKVFVYSITPFITMRCYEQIKVDVCYQNVSVTVVGVAAGYAYSTCGCTHHAIEDIAIMRALPNMRIYSPSNPIEAKQLTEYLLDQSGPAYLRLGKGGEPTPDDTYPLNPPKGLIVQPGQDITLFSTGTILQEALQAARLLQKNGISAEVINLHTIKPLDEDLIRNRVDSRSALFVLEEHTVMGGLGEAVARIMCEYTSSKKVIFKSFGVSDVYNHFSGRQEFMLKCAGLDAASVAIQIVDMCKKI